MYLLSSLKTQRGYDIQMLESRIRVHVGGEWTYEGLYANELFARLEDTLPELFDESAATLCREGCYARSMTLEDLGTFSRDICNMGARDGGSDPLYSRQMP